MIGPCRFGFAVAGLGDQDLDGRAELAVGAPQDQGFAYGAVWILSLDPGGTVAAEQKIGTTDGGFGGVLANGDRFGSATGALGDLDGDGFGDLAVGALETDDGGPDRGAVWILNLDGCLQVPGSEVVRLGTPPNPLVLSSPATTSPKLGSIWAPVIDHSSFAPGAALDALGISAVSANLVVPPLGTLLCDPGFLVAIFTGTPGANFLVALPESCAFAGLPLFAQGASLGPSGAIHLTNALDVLLGTL